MVCRRTAGKGHPNIREWGCSQLHTHETAGTDWNLFICSGVYLELLSSKKITEDVEEEIVGLDDHYHSHMARVRAKFDILVGAEVPSQ